MGKAVQEVPRKQEALAGDKLEVLGAQRRQVALAGGKLEVLEAQRKQVALAADKLEVPVAPGRLAARVGMLVAADARGDDDGGDDERAREAVVGADRCHSGSCLVVGRRRKIAAEEQTRTADIPDTEEGCKAGSHRKLADQCSGSSTDCRSRAEAPLVVRRSACLDIGERSQRLGSCKMGWG